MEKSFKKAIETDTGV